MEIKMIEDIFTGMHDSRVGSVPCTAADCEEIGVPFIPIANKKLELLLE